MGPPGPPFGGPRGPIGRRREAPLSRSKRPYGPPQEIPLATLGRLKRPTDPPEETPDPPGGAPQSRPSATLRGFFGTRRGPLGRQKGPPEPPGGIPVLLKRLPELPDGPLSIVHP